MCFFNNFVLLKRLKNIYFSSIHCIKQYEYKHKLVAKYFDFVNI